MAFSNHADGREYRRLRFLAGLIDAVPVTRARRYYRRWIQKANNRQRERQRKAEYHRQNPHIHCAKEARRRARKRATAPANTLAISQIYQRCAELRQWFDVVVDHIIPLAKGGAHTAENLQIIYAVENVRKGARLGYVPVVIFS